MPSIRTWLTLAAFATTGIVTMPVSSVRVSGTAVAATVDKYICMTDDGYGRKRTCSASYKTANPNWRGGDDCFTDEGYGRYRPCSSSYKAKHTK